MEPAGPHAGKLAVSAVLPEAQKDEDEERDGKLQHRRYPGHLAAAAGRERHRLQRDGCDPSAAGEQARQVQCDGHRPVSYTHLTLPTIYSV